MRAAGVVLVLLVCATSPRVAGAAEPVLTFLRDGRVVRTVDLETLRRSCGERVAIEDPYYRARKEYLACPLTAVLALGFAGTPPLAADDNVFFRAADGYAKSASGARLLEPGGFVAFADASLTTAAPGQPLDARWEPIDRRRVDPGPFYVVWREEAQRDPNRYPWPYQLVRIEIAPFEREYPHTVPAGIAAGAPAWTGYAIFRGECSACHSINGEGGKVGPDLNVPRSIVEYRPAEQIKAYVRNPESFRYTSMPPHPALGDAELDALVAYFEAMRDRKHDPKRAAEGAPGATP
ncbi:MAG TPA: cytochrome c [Myxococcota bacterium]|jgi:mono/diheme cytochrome c family protein|nr:cytochrome c [Myxococcota bacterium]